MIYTKTNNRCSFCAEGKKHPTPNKSNSGEFDKIHPWFINAKEYDYCFWNYVFDKSALNGDMKDSSMGEIAHMLDCSITTVHLILEKAINKLKKSGNLDRLLYYMEQKKKVNGLEDEFNRMVDQIKD